MPEGFLDGKRIRLEPTGEIGDAGVIGPRCNRAIAQKNAGAEDCEDHWQDSHIFHDTSLCLSVT